MSQITVVLADDHTLFRQGVAGLLSRDSHIRIVGEVSTASDAIELCKQVEPDVVLMDISMPGCSSFEATRQIKKTRPATIVLILSMYSDKDYLHQALESGASGYVLKDVPVCDLIDAVREVARGGSHLSPRMLAQVVDEFRGSLQGNPQVSRTVNALTAREREVLKLLAEGMAVKQIAAAFNLSIKTVEAHKLNLMRKLDLHNKAQLVHYAVQKNIIQLSTFA
jgi:two-component system, NarL family, response regulator NreC